MNPTIRLNVRQQACLRAHLAGAETTPDARRRYFRELEAIDILGGHGPSPFAELGK